MKKILIVDDDRDFAASVKSFLVDNGYKARTVAEPDNAIAQIEDLKPDLIISDIAAPSMDGLVFCRQIKSMDDFRDIPIIIMSDIARDMYKKQAFASHADYFIEKPFGFQEMLINIKKLLAIKAGYFK